MADREQPYDPYIPSGGAGQQGAQGQNGNVRTAALQAVRTPIILRGLQGAFATLAVLWSGCWCSCCGLAASIEHVRDMTSALRQRQHTLHTYAGRHHNGYLNRIMCRALYGPLAHSFAQPEIHILGSR